VEILFSILGDGSYLSEVEAARSRLIEADALGQLIERRGRLAELATEAGDVKLDWVDEIPWVLRNPDSLHGVEDLAEDLAASHVRHLIWSGMGGSVQAVRVLADLGWLGAGGLELHTLDSTDPRALNRLAAEIGEEGWSSTAMIAVSMGMTSEEPVAHLEWFQSVLEERGVPEPTRHRLVMSLPGSMLSLYASERGLRTLALQPDGANHIPGRMSAPSTKVFLLPVAIALQRRGALLRVLEESQSGWVLQAGLSAAERRGLVGSDPFVALACWLASGLAAGRDMVCVETDEVGRALAPWVVQLVEESLCKKGRGILTFTDQQLDSSADPTRMMRLQIRLAGGVARPAIRKSEEIPAAVLKLSFEHEAIDRLAMAARFFSGWNLVIGLVGYLTDLVFAGQPAVEGYKAYARELRDREGPLPFPTDDIAGSADASLRVWFGALRSAGMDLERLSRFAASRGEGPGDGDVVGVIAETIAQLRSAGRLGYLDLTVNGEPSGTGWGRVALGFRRLGNERLCIPTKLRSGPRAYHSTEQSQVDGPKDLLSIRVLVENLPAVTVGTFDERFFHAQALGTVLAMRDASRPVLLVFLASDEDGSLLADALEMVGQRLSPGEAE